MGNWRSVHRGVFGRRIVLDDSPLEAEADEGREAHGSSVLGSLLR